VIERCAGQLRVAPAGGIVGFDMTAALRVAEALGYDPAAVAELLPAAEAGAVKAINDQMDRS